MIASRAHAPTLAASVKLGTPLTVGGAGVAIDHGDDLSARYGVVGSERRGGLAEGDSGVICQMIAS